MKTIKIVSVISLFLLGTNFAFASIDKNLKYGQRDKEVMELQEFLIDKGLLKTIPSTYFGLLTFKAVKAYQASIGVSSTGFVGALTREKINKEIDIEVSSSNEAERAETSVTPNTTKVNTQVVANTTTGADSIYDSNAKTDSLGRKVTITQDPNYKFLSIVRAKIEITGNPALTGFFNKNTKIFTPESTSTANVGFNNVNTEVIKLTDYCKNIEGIQTKVPENMLVGNDSICFTQQTQTNTPVINIALPYVPPVPLIVAVKFFQVSFFDNSKALNFFSDKELNFKTLKFTKKDGTILPVTVIDSVEDANTTNRNGIPNVRHYYATLSESINNFAPAIGGEEVTLSVSDKDGLVAGTDKVVIIK
jgi:peptidoglycan hydrolase-like protein with peptidoglycan-binding domain